MKYYWTKLNSLMGTRAETEKKNRQMLEANEMKILRKIISKKKKEKIE